MIVTQGVNLKSCIACCTYQGPHETLKYLNDSDGQYHKWIYIHEGMVNTYPCPTPELTSDIENAPLYSGNLYDISPTKGKYVISVTEDSGVNMVSFNPIPMDRKLSVEIVKGTKVVQIKPTESRVTIFCISGPVMANDKVINSMQYSVVFENKTAVLKLEENSVCALITS